MQENDGQFKKLDGGQYAVYHYYDAPGKLNRAYRFMYGQWLPNSDYEADFTRNNLEFCRNNPAKTLKEKARLIYLSR